MENQEAADQCFAGIRRHVESAGEHELLVMSALPALRGMTDGSIYVVENPETPAIMVVI
jgi:hypothetical protein